jgi:hypothetical protein
MFLCLVFFGLVLLKNRQSLVEEVADLSLWRAFVLRWAVLASTVCSWREGGVK